MFTRSCFFPYITDVPKLLKVAHLSAPAPATGGLAPLELPAVPWSSLCLPMNVQRSARINKIFPQPETWRWRFKAGSFCHVFFTFLFSICMLDPARIVQLSSNVIDTWWTWTDSIFRLYYSRQRWTDPRSGFDSIFRLYCSCQRWTLRNIFMCCHHFFPSRSTRARPIFIYPQNGLGTIHTNTLICIPGYTQYPPCTYTLKYIMYNRTF